MGLLTGNVDKFSWKQVGLSALGSGVTAGLGAATNGVGVASKVFDVSNKYGAAAINAAASSIVTQGLAVATGLQDKFSWRNVATSAIAAPIATAASSAMKGVIGSVFENNAVLQRAADGIVRGVVSQSVRMVVTRSGKLDFASIAADAFGNALGESLVAELTRDNRRQAWLKKRSAEETDALGLELADAYLGQRMYAPGRVLLAGHPAAMLLGGSVDFDRDDVVGGIQGYLRAARDGAEDLMNSALSQLEERVPGLGKAMQTVSESLPEFYEAAKQELRDAAPGLIKDAVITVGGLLLAQFTGGASGALAFTRGLQRAEKVAEFTMGAYRAIRGATELASNLPNLLSDARTLISQGALGVVQEASGLTGSSIQEIVEQNPRLAATLPGIGHTKIDKLLGQAMELGDRLLKVATDNFTTDRNGRVSALFSAAANAVYRHGDVAERITGLVLENSGLFSTKSAGAGIPAMGPIQNRSGHGIDWVGRALTGKHAGSFVAFEVKGGLNGMAAGLTDQQSNLRRFMTTRLDKAFDAKGVWASRNTAPGTAAFAEYVRREMDGKKWDGYLIQHNNMRTRPSVTWKPW